MRTMARYVQSQWTCSGRVSLDSLGAHQGEALSDEEYEHSRLRKNRGSVNSSFP